MPGRAQGEPSMAESNDLYRLVGNIDGKIDLMLAQQEAADNRHSHLEGRVRAVESKQHWLAGAAAAVTAAATWIIRGMTGHT